jgi:hypothetical protein
MTEKVITRRDFLWGAAGSALAVAVGPAVPAAAKAAPEARVVLIRHADVMGKDGKLQPEIVQSMLDEAVKALLNEKTPLSAWRKMVRSSDIVGIKSNVWWNLPTPREVEGAIQRRVLEAGVPGRNMAVDDRGVLDNPVFQKSTALINVRPLRTHHWSGVGTCLKNYIMFVPDPSAYHEEGCSPLGRIWHSPLVKGKTRLNILCAFTPQFYGRGAHYFDRRYVWPYRGLIVGADPVAVDAVGAHLLRVKRSAFFGEDRTLDVPPVHIEKADKKYNLGVSDLRKIQLIKLGWQREILI